jgi:hypothetical protein
VVLFYRRGRRGRRDGKARESLGELEWNGILRATKGP